MPKFTVTVEVKMFVQLENIECAKDSILFWERYNELPQESRKKILNPEKHGKVTQRRITVEEAIKQRVTFKTDDLEIAIPPGIIINNNQIRSLILCSNNGEDLGIELTDGQTYLLDNPEDIYNFFDNFILESLPEYLKEYTDSVYYRLPF